VVEFRRHVEEGVFGEGQMQEAFEVVHLDLAPLVAPSPLGRPCSPWLPPSPLVPLVVPLAVPLAVPLRVDHEQVREDAQQAGSLDLL
jgi:hypothetical protein